MCVFLLAPQHRAHVMQYSRGQAEILDNTLIHWVPVELDISKK